MLIIERTSFSLGIDWIEQNNTYNKHLNIKSKFNQNK